MRGSLINHIMNNMMPEKPEIGMGVTRLAYTDRNAFTVIDIVSPKEIRVQRDRAKRVDNLGMSDCQDWEYEENPDGVIYTLTLRKNNMWATKGQGFKQSDGWRIGHREEYYDFSF